MDASEWVERFARELGAEAPDRETVERILELAAEAAHSSQRTAAPVACWLAAAGGIPLERALELAREIGDE
jgi:hypothetical protein